VKCNFELFSLTNMAKTIWLRLVLAVLPMAVNVLLEDPAKCLITITISPLKRLQMTQDNDFNTVYGIPTVVINEDTLRDEAWWNASHILLQLSLSHVQRTDRETSMTRKNVCQEELGTRLLPLNNSSSLVKDIYRDFMSLSKRAFQKLINRVNVDEVHHIHTAGLPHHGLDAFRPAWGRLDELNHFLCTL